LQFWTVAHILGVNCGKMVGDKPKHPAYKIFSIKRRF